MKKAEIFPSRYIKASDIGNCEIKVTISHVKMEELGDEREQKLVVYFQGHQKGLVVNVTNYDRIALIAGSEDTENWPGTTIVLCCELATFRGKTDPAVRVKALPANKRAPLAAGQDTRPEPPTEVYRDLSDPIPF
jgi:hypothetical protein